MTKNITVSLPSRELRDLLPEKISGVEFLFWDLSVPAPKQKIDIVVPPYMSSLDIWQNLSTCEITLVQSQSIGYDGVAKYIPQGALFANASSVHEASTAELAVGLAIASQREFGYFFANQRQQLWQKHTTRSFADSRVLIIGMGGVAKAIYDRLQGFEVRVKAVASTAGKRFGVDVFAKHDLPELLSEADCVILTLPLNSGTRNFVDESFINSMRQDALLINVARGPVVNTDALCKALYARRIRAAIDVCEPEPLPKDNPLWQAPGLLITPHIGGDSKAMLPRMVKLLLAQINKMLSDDDLLNIVDF